MRTLVYLTLIGMITSCTSTAPPKQGEAVNLAGGWEVDYKLTENAQEKLLFLYEIGRNQIIQQQKRREKSESGLNNAMAIQRSLDDLNGLLRLGTLADTMNQASAMRIRQQPGYIEIEREDDYALTCEYGEENNSAIGQEWCGFTERGELIFVARLPEGLEISHRFLLSDDGERLSVSTAVKAASLSRTYTVNRVYMPFDEGSSMYNCEFTLKKKKTCWLGSDQ